MGERAGGGAERERERQNGSSSFSEEAEEDEPGMALSLAQPAFAPSNDVGWTCGKASHDGISQPQPACLEVTGRPFLPLLFLGPGPPVSSYY